MDMIKQILMTFLYYNFNFIVNVCNKYLFVLFVFTKILCVQISKVT